MIDETDYGPDAEQHRKHMVKMYSAREYAIQFRKRDFFKPSPKQAEFANLPAHITEARLVAATQSGKTSISSICEAMDATGNYTEWIKPECRRFLGPPKIARPHEYMSWIISTSSQVQVQTTQLNLLGDLNNPHGLGSGYIHLDEIVGRPIFQPGKSGVVDNFSVRRKSGGTGNIGFRSREQNIQSFAGATLDQFRWDEPGAIEYYLEALARITVIPNGRGIVTLTPTEGRDALWHRFQEPAPYRMTIKMILHDATHMSPEQIQAIIDRTPEVDRPMRIYAEPAIGSGTVYRTPVDKIIHTIDPYTFQCQPWIRWGFATDVTHGGASSDFAAVLCAYDPNNDTLYIIDAIKTHGENIPTQCAHIKTHPMGDAVVVWPRDARQPGDAVTGETLASQYKRVGKLNMASHFVTDRAGKSPGLSDGVLEVSTRLETGRLRVAKHCTEWFNEYLAYHMHDNKIVKGYDDLMDATRVACFGIKQMRPLSEWNDRGLRGGSPSPSNSGGNLFDEMNSYNNFPGMRTR